MPPSNQNWGFTELLDVCSDCSSPCWEEGWQEFIRRYKLFIYGHVSKSCSGWNHPRMKRQFSDTVNDIVSDVIWILCGDHCRSLRQFLARDQEAVFLAWLATICRRAVSHHLRKHFIDLIEDVQFEQVHEAMNALSMDTRWEMHEWIVSILRGIHSGQKQQPERDILLYRLYVLADFPIPWILSLPCFDRIGHRVIDNVTYRMRQELRKRGVRTFFEDS